MEISGIISLVSQRSFLVLEPVEVGMRGKTGTEQLVGLNRKKLRTIVVIRTGYCHIK